MSTGMYARISALSLRLSDRFFYALRREMGGPSGNVRSHALATAGRRYSLAKSNTYGDLNVRTCSLHDCKYYYY